MTSVDKANIGDVIEFSRKLSKRLGNNTIKLRGMVETVRENAVIVNLGYSEYHRTLELDEKTVVNHKNYQIIKRAV